MTSLEYGPIKCADTPILWPPKLPQWWHEPERLMAIGVTAIVKPNGDYYGTKEDFRLELFIEQAGRCHWCQGPMSFERWRKTSTGKQKNNGLFATFEHLRPRADGGEFHRHNIRLAHGGCNNKRNRAGR